MLIHSMPIQYPQEGNVALKVANGGVGIAELAAMFPDEDAARLWFEELLWPNGDRVCPSCGSHDTHQCAHATMPYRCRSCRRYFSVRTGTVMAASPLPLLKWAYAIHLHVGNSDGVSSMMLHRELGITQKSAWHLQRRIREGFEGHASSGLTRRKPPRSGRKTHYEPKRREGARL